MTADLRKALVFAAVVLLGVSLLSGSLALFALGIAGAGILTALSRWRDSSRDETSTR